MGGMQGPELRQLGGTGVQRGPAVAAEGRDKVGQVRGVLGRMRPLGCCHWGLVIPGASWQEEMPLGRRDGEKQRAARGSCPMVWGCSEGWVWDPGGVPLL